MSSSTPAVFRIVGECVRGGICEQCGKHCRRSRNIAARSLEELNRKVAEWEATPLMHLRCELNALEQENS